MKGLKEEVIKGILAEKPTATLIGKQGTDIKGSKVFLVYKTRLESGRKILFHVPQQEGIEYKKEVPSQTLIPYLN